MKWIRALLSFTSGLCDIVLHIAHLSIATLDWAGNGPLHSLICMVALHGEEVGSRFFGRRPIALLLREDICMDQSIQSGHIIAREVRSTQRKCIARLASI